MGLWLETPTGGRCLLAAQNKLPYLIVKFPWELICCPVRAVAFDQCRQLPIVHAEACGRAKVVPGYSALLIQDKGFCKRLAVLLVVGRGEYFL